MRLAPMAPEAAARHVAERGGRLSVRNRGKARCTSGAGDDHSEVAADGAVQRCPSSTTANVRRRQTSAADEAPL